VKVFFQNRIVDEKKANVSVLDHGFLYGDGIYETVKAYGYRVFHWSDHYKRLKQSAKRIALRCPYSSDFLLRAVEGVLKANKSANGSVRITVARGPGPLGLDPAVCPQPTLAMLLHPERPLQRFWEKGVSIGIPRVRRNHPQCLDPQIKSNNSLNTILAKMEAKHLNVFEAVLLNLDGYLTEGTTANIFFVRRGQIFTPALSCGLLEGVTRGVVIQLARRAGYKVHEGRYTPEDLRRADEIFLTSTTLEIVPVISVLGGRQVWHGRPGPITRYLHAKFQESIH
jgi:branched-chain amino acid aminotransferase